MGKTRNLSALAFLFSSSDFDVSGPWDVELVPNLQYRQVKKMCINTNLNSIIPTILFKTKRVPIHKYRHQGFKSRSARVLNQGAATTIEAMMLRLW